MSTSAVTLFLALLTVGAQLAVVAALVLALAGRWWTAVARLRSELAAAVGPQAIQLGFIVALVATAGSLYFSEVAHFIPCKLCWYQRIAMYPLVPMLGLAVWRRDLAVRPYALTLALLGAPISAYHYLLERFPTLEAGACDPTNPCTLVWVWRFRYISIPLMAGSAFLLIAVLLLVARPAAEPEASAAAARGRDESGAEATVAAPTVRLHEKEYGTRHG